jgi:hypothetical protein
MEGMRALLPAVIAATLLGACGASADDDDDIGVVDPCPDLASCVEGTCGVIYRDGCAPIECGLCRYDAGVIDPAGTASSFFPRGQPLVAYIAPGEGVLHEVRLARFDGETWTSELVDFVRVFPPGNPATAVWRADDGTEWVAWSDSDPFVWTASRAPGGKWLLEGPLGRGVAPQLADLQTGAVVVAFIDFDQTPNLVRVHRRNELGWDIGTWVPDDSNTTAFALDARGFDVHVASRNEQQDVHYAPSRNGSPFFGDELEVGIGGFALDASVALDLDADGLPHVAYSWWEDSTLHAVKRDDAWRKSWLGRGFGQGTATAVEVEFEPHVAYMNAFGVQVADWSGDDFTEQTVAHRCEGGPLALERIDTGALLLVYSCYAEDGVYWLRRGPDRYPDGWIARCEAAADALYEVACSCAPDPEAPQCCITVETADATSRDCSAGQTPRTIARATVCGDPTVDPGMVDACLPAAAAATCSSDGEQGNVVVPAACLP